MKNKSLGNFGRKNKEIVMGKIRPKLKKKIGKKLEWKINPRNGSKKLENHFVRIYE